FQRNPAKRPKAAELAEQVARLMPAAGLATPDEISTVPYPDPAYEDPATRPARPGTGPRPAFPGSGPQPPGGPQTAAGSQAAASGPQAAAGGPHGPAGAPHGAGSGAQSLLPGQVPGNGSPPGSGPQGPAPYGTQPPGGLPQPSFLSGPGQSAGAPPHGQPQSLLGGPHNPGSGPQNPQGTGSTPQSQGPGSGPQGADVGDRPGWEVSTPAVTPRKSVQGQDPRVPPPAPDQRYVSLLPGQGDPWPTRRVSPEELRQAQSAPWQQQPETDVPTRRLRADDQDMPTRRVRPEAPDYGRGAPVPPPPYIPPQVPIAPEQQTKRDEFPPDPTKREPFIPGARPGHALQRSAAYGVAGAMLLVVMIVLAARAPVLVAVVALPVAVLLRAADLAQPELVA